jgi:hypothetical protein
MYWTESTHETPVGPIPRVPTALDWRDTLGRLRVRWAIGRNRYRVDPGLYAFGAPDDRSPVLVTANYKLTVDTLRKELHGLDAWLLVLDTRGINVWCAAGKGTFGTEEVIRRVQEAHLGEVVRHRTLVLPQLGAPGVAAHQVKERTGFRVRYGPVRAADLPAYLADRMHATAQMRRVTFTFGERMELVGVEVANAAKLLVPISLVLLLVARGSIGAWLAWLGPLVAAFLAGAAVMPLLLPWIPGRTFSVKGALVGAVMVGATLAVLPLGSALATAGAFLLCTALASHVGMGFTGASTFTSQSGVEWEMRRALPFQIGTAVAGLLAFLVGAVGV